ncbi:MAG: DUF4258 domain-containing protein [Planctomycetota bacterium]
MKPSLMEQIRNAVQEGRHQFSQHALDELHADDLHAVDAEAVLLTGELTRIQEQESLDVPSPRYTVIGTATDLTTNVGVVCRFEPPEQLLIITCYEMTG